MRVGRVSSKRAFRAGACIAPITAGSPTTRTPCNENNTMTTNEWTSPEHAHDYLARAHELPHRSEGEAVLLDLLSPNVRRVLDIGAGDGRTLALVLHKCPEAEGVALDFSASMLRAAGDRFAGQSRVTLVTHNLDQTLPDLGVFDVIVSSFAIHHLSHERKRSLYKEIAGLIVPGGIFANLEHVSSPTPTIHKRYLDAMGLTADREDPSNRLLDMETQLDWLREAGLTDVDCYWKWLEFALLAGTKPIAAV